MSIRANSNDSLQVPSHWNTNWHSVQLAGPSQKHVTQRGSHV